MPVDAVVGAQFGSEAKGAIACCLAIMRQQDGRGYDYLVRVAGPNAGHTGYDSEGRKWALRQIPVAAVVDPRATLYLGPGSEIDLDVLAEEVTALDKAGHHVRERLIISDQASILCPEHRFRESEALMHETMGSTGKGVGACRAERIMRKCPIVGNLAVRDVVAKHCQQITTLEPHVFRDTYTMLEGTQGYGLGLHAGYYPFCTSSDCRAIDFMAMAGIGVECDPVVWVVARTFPIRVAGPSGPLPNEVSWEQLDDESGGHIKPERTTVTKKIRRIGRMEPGLVQHAMAANRVADPNDTRMCLTFWDYIMPECYGMTMDHPDAGLYIDQAEAWCEKHNLPHPTIVGTGPSTWLVR